MFHVSNPEVNYVLYIENYENIYMSCTIMKEDKTISFKWNQIRNMSYSSRTLSGCKIGPVLEINGQISINLGNILPNFSKIAKEKTEKIQHKGSSSLTCLFHFTVA